MNLTTGNNFLINTEDCCFICLKNVRSTNDKVKEFTSVSNLLRYLNIKNYEGLDSGEHIPNECTSQRCERAQLCENCIQICGKVSKLVEVIDLAKAEISYHLKSIHNTMKDASRTPSRMKRFRERMKQNDGGNRKLQIVENFRGNISHNCCQVANFSQPRVILEKLKSSPPEFHPVRPKVERIDEGKESPEASINEEFVVKSEVTEDPLRDEYQPQPQSDEWNWMAGEADYSLVPYMESSSMVLPLESESMGIGRELTHEELTEGVNTCTQVAINFGTKAVNDNIEMIQNPNETIACTKCEKVFILGSKYFIGHIKTCKGRSRAEHAIRNVRKFTCSICCRQYTAAMTLRLHIRAVHEKVQKYSCDICGRKFAYSSQINPHKDRVHFRKRFACDVPECSKEYSCKGTLQFHKRMEHSENYK